VAGVEERGPNTGCGFGFWSDQRVWPEGLTEGFDGSTGEERDSAHDVRRLTRQERGFRVWWASWFSLGSKPDQIPASVLEARFPLHLGEDV